MTRSVVNMEKKNNKQLEHSIHNCKIILAYVRVNIDTDHLKYTIKSFS